MPNMFGLEGWEMLRVLVGRGQGKSKERREYQKKKAEHCLKFIISSRKMKAVSRREVINGYMSHI